MNNDIGHILESWPYNHDEDLIVRIIKCEIGKKIQMRIDMGIIQMELDGNPTGESPGGYESWFEYYKHQQIEVETSRIDDFFSLEEEDCKKLRHESVHYYYRYLCLMKLGDYKRVIRDTDRNYRLFEFVRKYAVADVDKWSLDQYLPYVIMMNTRARVSLAIIDDMRPQHRKSRDKRSGVEKALDYIDKGIDEIVKFYEDHGISTEKDISVELSILKALKSEFLRNMPLSLEEQLEIAIKEERFEDAAMLRDRIRSRFNKN